MPFGVMNAPSPFQRFIDDRFNDIYFGRDYLKDLVVFSAILEEHMEHVVRSLETIADHGLEIKLKPCAF